ncbi:hypothetical protein PInf_019276 [Phytophthora infestans]|nr:hypothetical protein PInf_019276 [Phytophthora infestans]
MAARFEGAKTSKQVNEDWSLVASQLWVNIVKVFTTTTQRAGRRLAELQQILEIAPREPKHMDVMTE